MTPAENFDRLPGSTENGSDTNGDSLSTGSITHWLDLFRAGNDEAVERLWDRYFASLVSIARAKLGPFPGRTLDAEDVALSAFHALYRAASHNRLPELQDRDELWQSLVVITSAKVVDAKRKACAQKRGGGQIGADNVWIEAAQSQETDPALAAIIQEQFDVLLQSLKDPELQQIALLKLEGCTNQEIAHRLNCGERTIKRRLSVIRRLWEEPNNR